MTEYHVVWRIEVHADSPVEAAAEAQLIMQEARDTDWSFEVAKFSDYHANGDRAEFTHVNLEEHSTT
jgi:hypothetical protein